MPAKTTTPISGAAPAGTSDRLIGRSRLEATTAQAKYVTTTTAASAATATTAVTIALAVITVQRRGIAANVGRIVPKPNSPVIAVAPITPSSRAVTTGVPDTSPATPLASTSCSCWSAVVRMLTTGGKATAIA